MRVAVRSCFAPGESGGLDRRCADAAGVTREDHSRHPDAERGRYLPEAFASVRSQQWPDLEHIVMDGGSTDDTLEILGRDPDVRVESGADGGLYDAINRGVALASGDVVGFLNADDVLTPVPSPRSAARSPLIPARRW